MSDTVNTDNRYVKADLEDYADLDQIEDSPDRWDNPSRSEILQQALGLDTMEIKSIRKGSYQGNILFVFRTGDYLWLLKDAYGSCSLCDGLIAADHASDYAQTMMRNAYAFEDDDDAIEFLKERRGRSAGTNYEYGWRKLISGGIDAVNELPARYQRTGDDR